MKISYCTKEITVHKVTDEDRELLDMKDFDMVVVVKSFTYLEGGHLFNIQRQGIDLTNLNL